MRSRCSSAREGGDDPCWLSTSIRLRNVDRCLRSSHQIRAHDVSRFRTPLGQSSKSVEPAARANSPNEARRPSFRPCVFPAPMGRASAGSERPDGGSSTTLRPIEITRTRAGDAPYSTTGLAWCLRRVLPSAGARRVSVGRLPRRRRTSAQDRGLPSRSIRRRLRPQTRRSRRPERARRAWSCTRSSCEQRRVGRSGRKPVSSPPSPSTRISCGAERTEGRYG